MSVGESITNCGLDFQTVVLCEVLELNVEVVATLGAYQRIKVLEVAKQNVKKWPRLNDVQRVEMNCALAGLQTTEIWKKRNGDLYEFPLGKQIEAFDDVNFKFTSNGRYAPIAFAGIDSTVEIQHESKSVEEDFSLSPVSSDDQPLDEFPAAAYQCNLHDLDRKSDDDSDDEKPSGIIVHYDHDSPDDTENSSPGIYDEEAWRGLTEMKIETVYSGKGNGSIAIDRSKSTTRHLHHLVHSNLRSDGGVDDGGVDFFPALTGHIFELRDCKIVIHEEDINAIIAEVMEEEEDVKKGKNGSTLAKWEMIFQFEDNTKTFSL